MKPIQQSIKFFIVKNAPTFRNEALLFFGLITPTTALFVWLISNPWWWWLWGFSLILWVPVLTIWVFYPNLWKKHEDIFFRLLFISALSLVLIVIGASTKAFSLFLSRFIAWGEKMKRRLHLFPRRRMKVSQKIHVLLVQRVHRLNPTHKNTSSPFTNRPTVLQQ